MSRQDPGRRKLAVVVFADIQGYSALMHADEVAAVAMLSSFRQITDEALASKNGRRIQNLGDGCLLVFSSAVEAMECAAAMQKSFITASIPVRIGLHHGDILVQDKNIFGDSVNIASRIETLAVAGSVLFSEDVWKMVRNHKELTAKELGVFTLKNIAEPIRVFALDFPGFSVPSRRSILTRMPGSGEGKLSWRKIRWPASAGILLLAVMAIFQFVEFSDTNYNSFAGNWSQVREASDHRMLDGELQLEKKGRRWRGWSHTKYSNGRLTDTLYSIEEVDDGRTLRGKWRNKWGDGYFEWTLNNSGEEFTGYSSSSDDTTRYLWEGERD